MDRIPEPGQEIFQESLRRVERDLPGSDSIPPPRKSVLKRVIHATADPEFAELLTFTNNPISEAADALRSGCNIVTDANMVRAGIRDDLHQSLGGNLFCRIKEDETARRADKQNTTRSYAAIQRSKDELDGGIAVIGMAPTALFSLIELIQENEVNPAVVVGVPVGYVKAVESKNQLAQLDRPLIYTDGKKGGSPVAAAVTNALLTAAHGSEQ